jgi:hypothetical protein
MDYSGDIAVALEQLQMANVAYYKALNTLKECKENRTACFKDFQKLKNQPSDMESRRQALDQAVLAEKAAEENLEGARTELRGKQSSYDKLKRLAASVKKAEKDSAAREKRQWEKAKEHHEQKLKEDQKATEEADKKKAKEEKEREEAEEARRKFWKDDYQEEVPPKSPHQPRKGGKRPRPEDTRTPVFSSAWKLACDKALSDRSAMTSFPDPPYYGCRLVSCTSNRNQRALKACPCNIAKALQHDPDYPESLKSERLRWHPDKFSICPEEKRAVFQAKAKEVFVVANDLYEREGKANNGE